MVKGGTSTATTKQREDEGNDGTSKPKETEGHGRRNRIIMSCEQCRKKKIKCDRMLPCGQCKARRVICDWVKGQPTAILDQGNTHVEVYCLRRLVDDLASRLNMSPEQLQGLSDTLQSQPEARNQRRFSVPSFTTRPTIAELNPATAVGVPAMLVPVQGHANGTRMVPVPGAAAIMLTDPAVALTSSSIEANLPSDANFAHIQTDLPPVSPLSTSKLAGYHNRGDGAAATMNAQNPHRQNSNSHSEGSDTGQQASSSTSSIAATSDERASGETSLESLLSAIGDMGSSEPAYSEAYHQTLEPLSGPAAGPSGFGSNLHRSLHNDTPPPPTFSQTTQLPDFWGAQGQQPPPHLVQVQVPVGEGSPTRRASIDGGDLLSQAAVAHSHSLPDLTRSVALFGGGAGMRGLGGEAGPLLGYGTGDVFLGGGEQGQMVMSVPHAYVPLRHQRWSIPGGMIPVGSGYQGITLPTGLPSSSDGPANLVQPGQYVLGGKIAPADHYRDAL